MARRADEQVLLGQFYTPPAVAALLAALTVTGERPAILDPACGDGALLRGAYELLATGGLSHAERLALLWGFELDPAAAEAAVRGLQRPGEPACPRIFTGDFFAREPDAPDLPRFDCILANPPYLRSQQQDDLDPGYRPRLFSAAARAGVQADAKTDLFAFFIYHALRFMKVGARLGFITPASWLTSNYASTLQRLLTEDLRLSAIVSSSAESFFNREVDVHTVLVVAERVDPARAESDAVLRFVSLLRPLAEVTGGSVDALARDIRAATHSYEDNDVRVRVVPLAQERSALAAAPGVARNWSRHLRAPLAFDRLVTAPAFTTLGQIARVSLGYKSLQNDFYYVDARTIAAYGIEARFLEPIVMLGDLDGQRYFQGPAPTRWVLLCREPEAALRGTGALRYIEAMAERPVASRKQSGPPRTIREVLAAQGGGLWYGPKARPQAAHLWLRKAFDSVYAPLLFEQAAVVDQRCNYLDPVAGLSWQLLAAVLTSSVFAYTLEVCGAASMGGGALEAATTRLRTYPVLDPRRLAPKACAELLRLAGAVWAEERPLDWSAAQVPGPRLAALDGWVLAQAGIDGLADRLHADLRDACHTRIRVARRG